MGPGFRRDDATKRWRLYSRQTNSQNTPMR